MQTWCSTCHTFACLTSPVASRLSLQSSPHFSEPMSWTLKKAPHPPSPMSLPLPLGQSIFRGPVPLLTNESILKSILFIGTCCERRAVVTVLRKPGHICAFGMLAVSSRMQTEEMGMLLGRAASIVLQSLKAKFRVLESGHTGRS